jgi:hypothetical protein
MIIGIFFYNFVNDGVRTIQVPAIFTSFIVIVSTMFNQALFFNPYLSGLNVLGLLISLVLLNLYGDGDFKKIVPRGKYFVGFKEFHVQKTQCAVSVYYPMDKDDYDKKNFKFWLDYRKNDRFIKAL